MAFSVRSDRTRLPKRSPQAEEDAPMPPTANSEDAVSPLELVFDLVFVFAVSQLSHHLLEYTTWRGATETAVMLIAVFGIWSYTSWGATLPGIRRAANRWTTLAIMVVGLFMNSGISRAFENEPWLFVVPYLLCRIGPALWWAVSSTQLRDHYRAMLAWFTVSAILWITGALNEPENRLWWWAAAALIELAGTWLAHPVPGLHQFRTQDVSINPGHMLERSRLFLLIALGEIILSSGTAVAAADPSLPVLTTAALSMLSIIAMWALYFGRSDRLIAESASTATNPLRAARLAVNTQSLVLAGLICVAVATELAIADPAGKTSTATTILMFGGPALYVGVQTWYLRAVTGHRPTAGPVAIATLAVAAAISTTTTPLVASALLATTLIGLVILAAPQRLG
jgi:low temperature requirement protein LtrA